MNVLPGSGFKSYVVEAEKDRERDQKVAKAINKMYERPDKELENRLLAGEVAIGHAKKVIRYNVHDDPTRGISGTLVCTNFRLCLITAERATYDLIELRNRLLNDHDILLNNIDAIYVEYPNKRTRLVPGSKVKDGIHRLELHCKDFRVAAFNFKLTAKGEEKNVITAILHHAYPSTVSLLFAFDHKHDKDVNEACKIPLYRSPSDWEFELRRCGVPKKKWKISVLNRHFTTLTSMGPYVVVPASIGDNEISEASDQFFGDRIPSWCWTDANGCSLVRAAGLRPETEQQHFEAKLYEAIQDADPQKRALHIIDVNKLCPSCLQLQQSFIKLKTLCMPASEGEFWESDTHWHSMLQSTKWLHHVNTTLTTAKDAAELLREKERNVVVKESSGMDLSCVVTSLIQLILNPTCRTIEGFQALVQREWVVAGHPFLDRLGHLFQPRKHNKQMGASSSTGDANQLAPVFLLFLDCVWQLYVQYPSRFEMNATFLTVLYDSTRMTAFDTFIFNNERQRRKALITRDNPTSTIQDIEQTSSWEFLPVWAWGMQFNKTDMTLFNNPLYKLRTMDFYQQYLEETSVKPSTRNRSSSKETSETNDDEGVDDIANGDVPDCTAIVSSKIAMTSFTTEENKKSRSPLRGSKKKRTEEHRRKLEMDNPLPLNKSKHKSGRVPTEGADRRGSKEENKNREQRPSMGHHPKVALMPKTRRPTDAASKEPEPDRRPSRSKSDSDMFDEAGASPREDSDDEESPGPLREQLPKTAGPSSPKLRSRWSVRRRKPKENPSEAEASCEDVSTYSVKMQDPMHARTSHVGVKGSSALYPCTSVPCIQLWRPCYLRWLPWSQIYGGGPAAMLQQESMLYDEIHILQNKLRTLKSKLRKGSPVHHSSGEDESMNISGMFFNFANSQENLSVFEPNINKSSSQNSLNFLSSYFPYSPVKDLRRKSIIGTPISNFLQGGSLFNFGGRSRKHARSPSNLSITHSLTPSIEDMSTESDGKAPTSRSLEDLTLVPNLATSSAQQEIYRSQSDANNVRERLMLLDRQKIKPRKLTPPSSPTENITYITSL